MWSEINYYYGMGNVIIRIYNIKLQFCFQKVEKYVLNLLSFLKYVYVYFYLSLLVYNTHDPFGRYTRICSVPSPRTSLHKEKLTYQKYTSISVCSAIVMRSRYTLQLDTELILEKKCK